MSRLTRRSFLFALAGVMTLRLPQNAYAEAGLFEPFSFAFVSDVHLAMHQSDSDIMLQESQLFLQDVVKTLNEQQLDFTIFGGDQVETPGKDEANWQLFLDVVQTLSAPWSFVLGEKDVSGARVVDKMKMYGPDWKNKGITTDTPYWSQSPLPGVHIIGLDTSKPNSMRGDLSNEQLDWLKKDLAKNSRRFTIVYSHHPLLPPPPFDGLPPWEDYTCPQAASAREVLNSSKYVHLALSGHVHVSKIQQERDIWYVSNPSLSLYPCAFRIFHVSADQITVETYQVSYPALIKKARQIFGASQLAFKYNERKPDTFAELAEGTRLDQNALIPLAAGAVIQPLRGSKRKKVEEAPKEKESKEQKKSKPEKESKESKQAKKAEQHKKDDAKNKNSNDKRDDQKETKKDDKNDDQNTEKKVDQSSQTKSKRHDKKSRDQKDQTDADVKTKDDQNNSSRPGVKPDIKPGTDTTSGDTQMEPANSSDDLTPAPKGSGAPTSDTPATTPVPEKE